MKIKNHKLFLDDDSQVRYVQAAHMSGVIVPEILVIHYTAGRGFEQSLKTLTAKRDDGKGVSAQLLIGRDGSIAQMVPFNRKAWHAGKSSWEGRESVGSFSIGIELDNYGLLTKRADGKYVTYFGRVVDPSEVVEARHKIGGPVKAWHAYSEVQLEKLEEVAEALVSYYKLKDVVGHDDIAPRRKSDPGGAFNMESLRNKLFSEKNLNK
jgi:N-acetylmuramoyl-L-alanine amidase